MSNSHHGIDSKSLASIFDLGIENKQSYSLLAPGDTCPKFDQPRRKEPPLPTDPPTQLPLTYPTPPPISPRRYTPRGQSTPPPGLRVRLESPTPPPADKTHPATRKTLKPPKHQHHPETQASLCMHLVKKSALLCPNTTHLKRRTTEEKQ